MSHKIFEMKFFAIYDAYINKVERKHQSQNDLDTIISWLTGYSPDQIHHNEDTMREFFENTPQYNEKASLVTGVICGVRVEDVEDPLMKQIRVLDKLVDELAKGKSLDKILKY